MKIKNNLKVFKFQKRSIKYTNLNRKKKVFNLGWDEFDPTKPTCKVVGWSSTYKYFFRSYYLQCRTLNISVHA